MHDLNMGSLTLLRSAKHPLLTLPPENITPKLQD